jgi:hypothetical protein
VAEIGSNNIFLSLWSESNDPSLSLFSQIKD